MTVKCLSLEHNTMFPPGLEPGPLDLEPIERTNSRASHKEVNGDLEMACYSKVNSFNVSLFRRRREKRLIMIREKASYS